MSIAYQNNSAVYLRIGKADRGDIHQSLPNIKSGRLIKVRAAKKIKYSFIATGSMVRTAIDIADKLHNINVWSVPFIKPIDRSMVEKICHNSEAVVVFEEHSRFGGLGSLIAEISSESSPVKILYVAVNDRFSQKCGTYEYLLKEHGLDFDAVYKNIYNFLLDL